MKPEVHEIYYKNHINNNFINPKKKRRKRY